MNLYRSLILKLSVALLLPFLSMAAVPSVDNDGGASDIMSITAVLSGTLVSTGALPTHVSVYWGAADGDTNAGSWDFSASLGATNALGLLSRYVTNLTPNQTYYYRYYATNADGEAWAGTTTNFQTFQSSGPSNVFLGETAHFVLLAGSAITTTGGGTVGGDAGVSPAAGSFIGVTDAQVNGVIYAVDASGPSGSVVDPVLLTTAQGDLTIAYNDARDRTPVPTGPFLNPGGGNIGGLTLVPGIYKFTSQALITGSDVTLYGGPDDVWIFQIATELIVGADVRKVILSGGAQARNVYWQVGTSATLGTFSEVKGTIMADQAITIDTSAVLEGRALARIANVVFNGLSADLPADPQTNSFFTLTYTAGPGGAILGTATQSVSSGTDGTPVTPFPDLGYEFVQWSDLSTATPRTDLAVTGNIAVEAVFTLSSSPCGTVVTLGAIMERDQTGLFTGSGLTLSAVSSAPGVMSAAITSGNKLRLVALAAGNAVITVNATSGGPLQSYAFMVTVVGNPAVISSVFPSHEPWNPRFEHQITVRNTSGCDAIGLRLLFSNLRPGITVENQTGTVPSPDGRVMIEWSSDFPNNAQQMLGVIYISTGAYRPDQYPPTVEVQYILPNTEPAPSGLGAPVNLVKVVALGDGRTLLEFESIPGHRYAVQYMNGFPVGPWVNVPLILNAGANRTQWIDYGPPATSASSGTRVYQVLEVFP